MDQTVKKLIAEKHVAKWFLKFEIEKIKIYHVQLFGNFNSAQKKHK